MSDDYGNRRLLDYLRRGGADLWSILPELAGFDEPTLRGILRPHDEAGLSYPRDGGIMELRGRLDRALDALTLLEIGFETGVIDRGEQDVPALDSLGSLFRSEALLQYANAYLYFGIRFLAYRVFPPIWTGGAASLKTLEDKTNQRPFPLVVPPAFDYDPSTDALFGALVDLADMDSGGEALRFLDGFYLGSNEVQDYELWLRGLRPDTNPEQARRFETISAGLRQWSLSHSAFYLSLQAVDSLPVPAPDSTGEAVGEGEQRPMGGWIVVNPIAARFALSDSYWIARLFRADVSGSASVTYSMASWMHLLRFQASLRGDAALEASLRKAEEVLRSVFDYVCDLVQNAAGLSLEKQRNYFDHDNVTSPPATTRQWRDVFDEELDEIVLERSRRRFRDTEATSGGGAGPSFVPSCPSKEGWSERLKSGRKPHNLIGLAFSGGGIRSATFNLGVLQGLQEFDQLRFVDYLSTVSGGGFIGSWLIGNVKRSRHWLGRLTCWDESIAHLRAYSNYLAPRSGVLSADTWAMVATWVRNAFLIQLTGFSVLLALLLSVWTCRLGFLAAVEWTASPAREQTILRLAAALMAILVTACLVYNFTQRVDTGKGALASTRVRYLAVLPSWISAFLVAVLLWTNATRNPWAQTFAGWKAYSKIVEHAWQPWLWLLVAYCVALLLTAAVALSTCALANLVPGSALRTKLTLVMPAILRAAVISLACLVVLYLELCAIFNLFLRWSGDTDRFSSYAFVFGPALVLAAFTVSIVLFIGLSGRISNEPQREWWTRFGTWVAIYAVLGLGMSGMAVFGPRLVIKLLAHPYIQWGTISTWIGTVIAGLFSGKSSKTSGETTKAPGLEFLAKAGGLLFIVGGFILTATMLYLFLLNFGTAFDLKTRYWTVMMAIHLNTIAETSAVVILCALLFSWSFEINIFGLNQFYRNRLVRCYLGATRWAPGARKPHPFTKFDFKDDFGLGEIAQGFRGPFPILSCALNLAGSSDLALHTRHSASFSLTPLRCGCDRPKVGYAPTGPGTGGFANGVKLGQAVSISGAAASPNMGYNTSPLVAFLLTMFNVRLGWWFPNPGQRCWNLRGMRVSLYYLTRELFGLADETRLFLNVSDGGHFENLGIYELVRRRCKVIIASDAECDEQLQFGGLGNVIRLCETDFGAVIDIDVKSIRRQQDGISAGHCTVGKIKYSNGSLGYLLYLKASITADEDVSIAQYRASHPTFPHEATANQFFSEDQFESYRKLGQHIVRHSLRGLQPGIHPVAVAERLADVLAPAGCHSEAFLKHSRVLDRIWERFRSSSPLASFLDELMGTVQPVNSLPNPEETCLSLELLQLMEDVFMDLRMDDFWEHPDNRGWAMLFMSWARSPRFRNVWAVTHRTFGIRFEYFCATRLGLFRDDPIVRV